MSKQIEVYTIQTEDYGYTSVKSCVLNELDHLEVGDTLTVTKRMMDEKEFDELPELNY